jgi:hypothetical protein
MVTGSSIGEASAMAVGIDLGFVAIELSQLLASSDRMRKELGKYSKP